MDNEPRHYIENRFREAIKEIEAEVDVLDEELDDAQWEPESDYHRRIDDLRIALQRAGEQIAALEGAPDAAWASRKSVMETTLKNLGNTLKDVKTGLGMVILE
jgi:hypothetical protein